MTEQPRLSPARQELLRRWKSGAAAGAAARPGTARPEAVRAAGAGPVPLTFQQLRLWFLDRLVPGSPAYNIPVALRLTGPLDVAALRTALTGLVERHDVLRTTVAQVEDGEPVQVTGPARPVALPVEAVAGEEELRALVDAEARAPFDLAAGPLYRFRLLRLDAADHVLLLTWSHLVADGWSAAVFSRELSALYRGAAEGRPVRLPPLPLRYADYAVRQRETMRGERLERLLAHWKRVLAGAPAVLDLPTDRPRPAIQSFRGDAVHFALPADLTARLKELAGATDTTLFMVVLAAFKTLLHRYGSGSDLVVGTPIANRGDTELEGVFGFFANTLALRTSLAGDPSFRELLGRVRSVTLEAYAAQDLPFEKLVDELGLDHRSTSHNPVFQVMYAHNNTPAPTTELAPGLSAASLHGNTGAAKFDLWLSTAEVPDGMRGVLEYATDLFDRASAERLIGHLRTLLEGVTQAPDTPLSRLPLLAAAEREQLVHGWNATDTAHDGTRLLHRLVEEQVARTPEAVAVVHAGRSLTYRELNAWANRIAHRLARHGVGPESVVAVAAERSPELVAALLGVVKAGGAYLPLDPSYPRERLAHMLRDSRAGVLLVQEAVRGVLPPFDGTALALDGADGEPEHDPDVAVRPDGAAYVIYTSGSTGLPKGVVNTHEGIVNRLRWMQDAYGLTARDRVLQKTPYSFDVSVWEFFWPLAQGARLVSAVPDGHRDTRYLAETIAAEGITVVHFVPSMLRLFLAERDVPRPAALRLVVCSGEALPYELQQECAARLPGVRLENLYGPTEAAVDVTRWSCRPGDPRELVPIGSPVANTRVHLLDAALEPVPVGVPGELYIGGVQVARGYLARPALTAERFVPDPFAAEPGGRLYRTGDLARRLPDGSIEFLGRVDHQIKLRGLRIEPGEIEEALRAHAGVRDTAVVARRPAGADTAPDPASGDAGAGVDDRQLVAYVVLDRDGARQAADSPDGEPADGQVGEWAGVFDTAYARREADPEGSGEVPDASFDLAGWDSSYTGEPLPAEEMRAWVDGTVERILALRPRRVLELGCGTGLLLFRVAPHCESYVGADISRTGLEGIRRALRTAPLPQVSLVHAPADHPDLVAPGTVDTVVINSVAQYFPDPEYLTAVLRRAVAATAPGGRVFLGDLRDLGLLEAFHASVEVARADAGTPARTVRARVAQRVREEQELAVDPAFLTALRREIPRIGRVEVQLKGGGYDNELSRFRYDAVLHLDVADAGPGAEWREWEELDADGAPDAVRALLAERGGRMLGLLGAPNGRTAPHVATAALLERSAAGQTVADVRAAVAGDGGPDPEAYRALAAEFGLTAEIRRSARHGADRCDVLFRPADAAGSAAFPGAEETDGATPLTNRPLDQRLARELTPVWRAWLKERLPDYMVPAFFVPLPALPLTPSGKCDRSALPEPPQAPQPAARDDAAPGTPEEELLAKVWCEVLGLDRVGVRTNYFELGGDSIRGVRVVSRANREGLALTLRDLFQYPTITELAAVAARQAASAASAETSGAAAAAAQSGPAGDPALAGLGAADLRRRAELLGDARYADAYPLSPFQAHMLARWAADPRPEQYLVQRVEVMRGPLDTTAFAAAWRHLAERFPILRTSFVQAGFDEPLQVVHRRAPLPVRTEDWTGLTPAARDEALRAYLERDKKEGLPPDGPHAMRLLTARVADDAHIVVLSFSYLRVDGWSLALFTEALLADYAERTGARPPAVDEGPAYREFIAWVRRHGTRPDAREYWSAALAGLPAADLPRTAPGNRPGTEHGFARQDVRLPASVTDDLLAAARELRRTPNLFFQAAWAVLLGAYAHREEAVFGVFVNGRPSAVPGIEAMRGPTMNLLPLRVRGLAGAADGPGTLAGLVEALSRQGLELDDHAQTPPHLVARWAGRAPFEPLFDSYLVFQNLDPESFLSTAPVPAFFSRMGHPLRVDVFPGRRTGIALSYHRDVFQDAAVERILADFATVLAAAAARPGITLSELARLVHDGGPGPATAPRLIVEGALSTGQIDESPVLGADE
ncbi:amino acid adenylation domain-containing protein [Streptomyces mexicanus]|uniref:amino acid adenylation domain-containing protein n=1 Tax=Streptomyces mexicanus TaxID=178566 RepID=UPI00364722BA